MKEIGSEFWDVPTGSDIENRIPQGTKWFISGTAALEYILDDILSQKKIQTAAMPSWCCDCMIRPFLSRGIKVTFYPVYFPEDRVLTCDLSSITPCDITLLLSYFGYSCQKIIASPSEGVVIRDVTHSLFTNEDAPADYRFGSLRKWAGFWTGGFAQKTGEWSFHRPITKPSELYLHYRMEGMRQKEDYIRDRSQEKSYLDLFSQGEDYLDHCTIEGGAERDLELARRLDISFLKAARKTNAKILLKGLKKVALFASISDGDCPLFVPILLEHERRERLRRHLIEHSVYCPVHWPKTELHRLTERAEQIYDQELSIVCDQRYGSRDMERILDLIRAFDPDCVE